MIMQTLNLVYSKDTSQTSVKTKPSPITLAAKQGTSNNQANTTPPHQTEWILTTYDVGDINLPSLTLTILLSPSLILVQVIVGNEVNMVWNLLNAPSSGNAMLTAFSWLSKLISRRSNGMAVSNLKSKSKFLVLKSTRSSWKIPSQHVTTRGGGGEGTQVYYWQGGTKAFLSDYCLYGDLSRNTHLTIIYTVFFFSFSVFLCGPHKTLYKTSRFCSVKTYSNLVVMSSSLAITERQYFFLSSSKHSKGSIWTIILF